MRFSFKAGKITVDGSYWNQLALISGGTRTRFLKQSSRWKDMVEGAKAEKKDLQNSDVVDADGFDMHTAPLAAQTQRISLSRPELDQLLGQSRSGTHRILVRLKRKGLLKTDGKARKTRYWIRTDILKKIKEGVL